MLVSPLNIETNKLVRKKVFNFDTSNRMQGNLVFVPTTDYNDYTEVVNAKLFKPQQMFSVFTPRRIKPMGRFFVTYQQKEIYQELREKTNGFLKIGKALPSSYVNRNLLYNLVPEYTETYNTLNGIRKSDPAQHIYMSDYIQNLIKDKARDFNYERVYVIFPMTKYIPNFKSQIQVTNSEDHSPIIEFLKAIRHDTLSKELAEVVDRVFFYNPFAHAMVAIDLKDEKITEKFNDFFMKINRLNNFNNKTDLLDDVSEVDEETDEDNIENTKDKIKAIVLANVSKKLGAKLDDYDSATMEEKGLITSIDKKIETYLNKDDNITKPFAELVKTVEADKDISTKAVNYIESKKIAQKQMNQLIKNIDRETEVINSIDDITVDDNKTFEPESIKAKLPDMIDKRIQVSSLTAFDNKYNEIQAKEDLISCIASFSEQEYLPITIVDWNLVDTSDDFTLKQTLTVRYKTDENKTFSFKIDIPIVFDGRYIKVKGNTYIIQKQLCRLPIVKTKENRVEITTNFNKITCERTNGKVSRRNAYLQKILQKYKMNPAFQIEYGYNIELNSAYKNDFEYEEMSSFLSKIKTLRYEVNTNRSEVEKEFALLDYPETFTIKDTMTPVGFEYDLTDNTPKNLLFIENSKLYVAIPMVDDSVTIHELAENLYTFIVKDLLKDDPDRDETIGKSYIYSNCKFIGVVYPIFVFCGLNIGITSVLQKAKIKYKISETQLSHSAGWVEVKFKNKWLYYEDTLDNTMLLNVLYALHTDEWDYEDFDTEEPYVDYCVNTLGQPIYVKQTVKINVSKLIDPITRDVLNYLKLPTNPFDLLILASKMLTSNSFISKNDLCNYRVRGNELIYAMLYGIVSTAIYKMQNASLNGSNKNVIKIGQNELISLLISQQNINIASNLNPILEMESSSSCSMKGYKGISSLLIINEMRFGNKKLLYK